VIAVIGLESIGDDARFRFGPYMDDGPGRQRDHVRYLLRPKAWVAVVRGTCPRFGLHREFLPFKKDYHEASGNGARGVYKWFEIEDRSIVEVNAPISWKRADRYFAASWGGRLFRITREEVLSWIAISRLASVG
jgi:hypothetical protein